MENYSSVRSLYHTLYAETLGCVKVLFAAGRISVRIKISPCALSLVCYNMYSILYWRLSPMASTKTPSARELRKKKFVRAVAIVACAALLITAILPYIASALY